MKRARQGILIKKGEYSYHCVACSETSSEVLCIIPVIQVQKKKKKEEFKSEQVPNKIITEIKYKRIL